MNLQETFKFRYPPFSDTFEVREPFLSTQYQLFLQRALNLITQGKSLCLHGEPGTGKSMLLKALAAQLDPKTYRTALIPYANIKRAALLRELCEEFGVDTAGRASLLGRLRKYFAAEKEKLFPVLMVDDAHAMEKESFMDLCALLHEVKSRTAAAALVLCGHGRLKTMLGLDIYASVRTRLAFTFRINSLGPEEAAAFVKHRLKIAGADPAIFEDDAITLLAGDTGGNRRELMNRCALAMQLAAERKEKLITPDLLNSMEPDE